MSDRRRRRGASRDRARVASQVGPGPALFVAAIAVSAFLLFTIELLAGRLVLPIFGGTPGVWTTALVLFTGLLFVGYVYAHIVATHLDATRGGVVHLVVTGLALVATLLSPSDIAALRVPGMPEALNVLVALLLICGPAVFLLATTTPLLSAWFAGRGGEPYWLYAVSNGASFVALSCYPLLIEPTTPLSLQRLLVAAALVVYAGLLLAVIASGRRPAVAEPPLDGAAGRSTPAADDAGADTPAAPTFARQLRWLLAAFVPAGLLSATTNVIATDLVSAPLVWVGPLSIYLASFVVAFSAVGRRSLRYVEYLVPAAATLLWFPFVLEAGLAAVPLLGIELGAYAILAIALHGRLALDRPDPRFLTRFYVILSFGGLLATTFVALVAPLAFNDIYEYPLLIVVALVVLALLPGPLGPRARLLDRSQLRRHGREAVTTIAPFALVAGLLWLVYGGGEDSDATTTLGLLIVAGGAVIAIGRSPGILALGTAVALVLIAVVLAAPVVTRVRTFFGVTEVRAQTGPSYAEYSGTTLHGVQFRDGRSRQPTSYYVQAGPLGDAFADLRRRLGTGSIGVVGLGTGTIAAYKQPGDQFTFFEINPAIVGLAHQYFTYLDEGSVVPRIVLGDARLSLRDEPDGSYDLIVLDAFSSDAVPAHLLTTEAMEAYRKKLRPGGLLAFHVSNRYYDLASAVTATARAVGLDAADLSYQPGPARMSELAASASEWVLVGARKDIERFIPLGWSRLHDGPVLTDDFNDLLRILR